MEARTGKQTVPLSHLTGPFSQRKAKEQLFSTSKDTAEGLQSGVGLLLAGEGSLYRTAPPLLPHPSFPPLLPSYPPTLLP